jgi:tetratricopeptide (TPR) repeat protein
MARRSPTLLLLASLAVGACASPPRPAPALDAVAIVDVNLVPMDREGVVPHQTVLVRSGRIEVVGPAGGVTVPEGTSSIDGRGKYLLPGLTDAHVHLLSTTELPLYVANGVTTVYNLDGRPAHLLWREQIEHHRLLGPRIFTTGPMFNVARTAAEDVQRVDAQAEAGYDGIKVYVQVSKDEYPALIAEAKRKHLLLMGHIPPGPGFEAVLDAGQSIAHAEEFTYTFFNPRHDTDSSHIVYDESKIPQAAQMTARAGVSVIATISCYRDIVRQTGDIESFLRTPELKYLAPWTRASLQPAVNRYTTQNSPARLKQLQTSLEFQRKLLRALLDADVPLMVGTDATNIGPVAGFAIHQELAELVRSGLTPFQALQAATVNPARYFGRTEEFGSIAPGRRADLLLVSANPLTDIANVRQISGVALHGRWFDHEALEAMKEHVPAAYDAQLSKVVGLLKSDAAEADRYLHDQDPLNFLGSAALAEVLDRDGAATLLQLVRQVRQANPSSDLASEDTVNNLGYQLLGEQKNDGALRIFAANVEDFPRSANALDSLADGYVKTGDVAKAADLYRRALALDPKYVNAEFAGKYVQEHTARQ